MIGNERTKLLIEQNGAVNSRRLGEIVGRVSVQEHWGIDDSITLVLGFTRRLLMDTTIRNYVKDQFSD